MMSNKRLITGLAAGLLVVACSSDDSVGTTTESTLAPPPTVSTTAAPPTTTTTTPTTTSTDRLGFLRETTTEERERYGLTGAILLNNTVFSLDDVGSEQFAEMLVFGAQAACVELHNGGTIADAMHRSLFESPVQSKNPQAWTAEETAAAFSMAIHVMTWGLDLYCPDLKPSELAGEDDSVARAVVEAWQEVLGS